MTAPDPTSPTAGQPSAEPSSGPSSEPSSEPTVADLTETLLGETPRLSGEEIAAAAGVPLKESRRLWRALGFADAQRESAFIEADADALRMLYDACDVGGLDFETVVRMTRAVGQTLARLADWEVATISTAIERRGADALTSPDGVREALELAERLGPSFEELLVYAWRRHLAAAIGRIELLGASEDDLHVAQATVGFADLVQFTALSNELDEHEIGDLVELFESRCSDVIADHNGRVIKTLGDSVLFMQADPVEAIEVAMSIVGVVGRDDRLPDVRLGLATGPVVLRMGDIYGPAVNLAARYTAVARRNRVIIDERTAELLPAERYETRRLPARPIRGFGDLEPFTVRPSLR